MTAILIDCNKIEKCDKLKSKLKPQPSKIKNFSIGLILVIPTIYYQKLCEIKDKKRRIDYLNSSDFVNNIIDHCYIMCNNKRKICVLNYDCYKILDDILSALFTGFPSESIIWVKIDLTEQNFSQILDKFISEGFCHPYITSFIPLVNTQNKTGVALLRKNVNSDNNQPMKTLNKVLHIMQNYKKEMDFCHMNAMFSKNAIKFLKDASETGGIVEDGKKQRELTGELKIKNVIKLKKHKKPQFVYVIDINKKSVSSGEEENVDVSATRYNFHSHPKDAYINHSVENAWPSATDYLGCKKLGIRTIFHCVTTLEGLYIISINPYWGKRLKNVDEKFIIENYNINHKENLTPEEYVEKINKILYKNNTPIYKLLFLRWKNADKVFDISFSPTENNEKSCLVSEEIYENYKNFHYEV